MLSLSNQKYRNIKTPSPFLPRLPLNVILVVERIQQEVVVGEVGEGRGEVRLERGRGEGKEVFVGEWRYDVEVLPEIGKN